MTALIAMVKFLFLISILFPWFLGCGFGTKTSDIQSKNGDAAKIEEDSVVDSSQIIMTPVPRVCGNGALELGEFCDDGNNIVGDGCNFNCQLETVFNPYFPPIGGGGGGGNKPAKPRCGNSIVELKEDCDDGNSIDTDGCTFKCKFGAVDPPIFHGAKNIAAAMGDTVLLNWENAFDQFTMQDSIQYLIYVSSLPGQQDFSKPVKTITSGELASFLSSIDTPLITPGATLYFVVRAQNREGLIDDNRVELSVTLSPPSSIAYVSDTSDGTGTLGNPFDPYPTIQSAINAVVGNGGGSIFVDAALNGTLYNEELNFTSAVSHISLFGGFNRFSTLPPQPTGLDILRLRDLSNFPTTVGGPGLAYNNGDLIRIVNNGSPTIIDGFTIDGQNGCSNEIRSIDAHFQLSGSILDQDTCLFADTTTVTVESILRIVGNQVFGQNSNAFSVGGGINALHVQNNNVKQRDSALDSLNTITQDFKVLTTGTDLLISHNTLVNGDGEALNFRFSPALSASGGPLNLEISYNEIRDFSRVARVVDYAKVGDNGNAELTILNNLFLGFNSGFEIDMIDGDPYINVDASLLWQYNVLQNIGGSVGLDINDVIVSANSMTTLRILDSVFANSESEIIEISDADLLTDNLADGGQIELDVRRNSIFSGEDFEIELGTTHGGLTKITIVENAVLGSEDEAINVDIEPYLGTSTVNRPFPDGLVFLTIFNNNFHGGDDESFELRDDRGSDLSAAFVYVGHNYLADSPDPSEVGVDFDARANSGSFLFERNFIGVGGQDNDEAFAFETSNSNLSNFFRLQNNVITLGNGIGIETSEVGGQLQIINNTVAYNGERDRFGIGDSNISLGENSQTFISNSIISHHAEADLQPGYETSFSLIRDGINGVGFSSISGEPIYLKEPADLPFPITVDENLKDLFTLAPTSPAIDAGNPLVRYNDPDGSRNDMGAYGGPAACPIGFGVAGREVPLVWSGIFPAVDLFTGAGLIGKTSSITLAFTRPVSSATLSAISVTSGGSTVPGSFSTSAQGHLITFRPVASLTHGGDSFVQFSLKQNLQSTDGARLAYPTTIRIPVKPTAIPEVEANNTIITAQQLLFGPSPDTAVVTGSANDNTDEDFYSFTASAGNRLMVTLFDSRSTLVPDGSYELQLLDSSSTVIKEGTIDAFNNDPYLDTVISTTDTYFLRVRNPGVAISSAYEIQAVID